MRKPGGYFESTGPSGKLDRFVTIESDTFTCQHCGKVVFVKPMCDPADAGGLCKTCNSLICPQCVARGVCDPLEEKLKREEASYHARRSYGF